MITDKEFLTMNVSISIEGVGIAEDRKISRSLLTCKDSSKEILQRELQESSKNVFKKCFEKITSRSGLENEEDIKNYLEKEFKNKFPEFEADFSVLHDKIVLWQIYHADWFIKGVGANPKYPEIEHEHGFTQITDTYMYVGDGKWTHLRQGHDYYPLTSLPVETPFKQEDIVSFIADISSKKGYKLGLEPVYIQSQQDYERMLESKKEYNNREYHND